MNSADKPDEVIISAMYPAPWRVEISTGTNRAAIWDNGDSPVISGMNILKARIIANAINDRADLLVTLNKIAAQCRNGGPRDTYEAAIAAIRKAERRTQ